MEKNWIIKVWGVRGSFPVPDAHFLIYGGNTSCISAEYGGHLIVLDAGSGLIQFGDAFCKKGRKRVDILISHFHIDHIMGLFRFQPLYDQSTEIHLYGGFGKSNPSNPLETLIGTPYWPVGLHDCAARITLHHVNPGEHFFLSGIKDAGDAVQVYTMQGNHPGQSILYRLEAGGKSIVYALDCEINETVFHSLSEFSNGADLVIWDAHFTEEDLRHHKGWGHSCWKEGAGLCPTADIKKILMTHYSPDYPDEFLKKEEAKAVQMHAASCFAKEGMVLQI